jgi:hypothetical protein
MQQPRARAEAPSGGGQPAGPVVTLADCPPAPSHLRECQDVVCRGAVVEDADYVNCAELAVVVSYDKGVCS